MLLPTFSLAWAWVGSFAHTDSELWVSVCLPIRPRCWLELVPSAPPNGLRLARGQGGEVQKQVPLIMNMNMYVSMPKQVPLMSMPPPTSSK